MAETEPAGSPGQQFWSGRFELRVKSLDTVQYLVNGADAVTLLGHCESSLGSFDE